MVNLFKKSYNYKNKDGEEKTGTRFYLECGDSLIPIEVTYFDKKDEKYEFGGIGREWISFEFDFAGVTVEWDEFDGKAWYVREKK
jgi:hypothetical protein